MVGRRWEVAVEQACGEGGGWREVYDTVAVELGRGSWGLEQEIL